MTAQSICSNCGNTVKDRWLVCKFCHQARWKLITPYFAWGAVFLVGAWWLLTKKVSTSAGSDNPSTFLLPGIGAIFGMIGAVMLLMALLATLRGLKVRKVSTLPLRVSSPDWHTTAPGSPAGAGAIKLNTPAAKPSIPDAAPPVSFEIQQMQQELRDAHQEIGQLQEMSSWLGSINLLPRNIAKIIRYLMNTDERNREAAIASLLNFGSPGLRQWVVKILGAAKEKESLPALTAISERDPYAEEREIPDPLNASLDYYDRERETIYPIREAALGEKKAKENMLKELNPDDVNSQVMQSDQVNQPAQSELDKQKVQAIHCQKCKHENAPGAKKCSQCGTDLLPGAGIGQRLGVLGSSLFLAVISFFAAFLFFKYNAEWGGKDLIFLLGLIGFGVLLFGFGILWSLRKTPLHERYEIRAKRHVSLNPQQAIADYGAAINSAPKPLAFDYLLERAKLSEKQGMTMEARTDWQYALENINARLAKPKAPVDLKKQRAEIKKNLGIEDEYAMEMLQYTIEKENTFKFKRGHIAEGWEEGLKQGSEDFQRQELQKLRAEIMKNHKYGVVGQCKKCKSIVDLDARLDCTNNPKHQIKEINPTLRKTESL
jgi:ribosomal protein L40E